MGNHSQTHQSESKGKNTVINTNQNGEFEIKGVDEDAVLLVSYVGFKTWNCL